MNASAMGAETCSGVLLESFSRVADTKISEYSAFSDERRTRLLTQFKKYK